MPSISTLKDEDFGVKFKRSFSKRDFERLLLYKKTKKGLKSQSFFVVVVLYNMIVLIVPKN